MKRPAKKCCAGSRRLEAIVEALRAEVASLREQLAATREQLKTCRVRRNVESASTLISLVYNTRTHYLKA